MSQSNDEFFYSIKMKKNKKKFNIRDTLFYNIISIIMKFL